MNNRLVLIVLIMIFISLYAGCCLGNVILQAIGGIGLFAFAIITIAPGKSIRKK